MLRFALLCALVLASGTAQAQFDPNKQIGSHDPHNNEGMVFALPTGEQALYLTIVTHDQVDPNTRDAQVLAWFDQDPRLNKLKKQCNYNHYWHTNAHYAEPQGKGGMGRCFGIGYPCVAITKANGELLASAYYLNADGKRGKLPNSSSDLADLLWRNLDEKLQAESFVSHSSPPANAVTQCRPDQPCYPPNQTPGPNGPVLPEVDTPYAIGPYLKELAPIAVIGVVVLVLLVYFKSQQAATPEPSAPTPPQPPNSFF